jgi:hypothetical protein
MDYSPILLQEVQNICPGGGTVWTLNGIWKMHTKMYVQYFIFFNSDHPVLTASVVYWSEFLATDPGFDPRRCQIF